MGLNVVQDWSKMPEGMPKEDELGTDWERVSAEEKPEQATRRDSLGSKAML